MTGNDASLLLDPLSAHAALKAQPSGLNSASGTSAQTLKVLFTEYLSQCWLFIIEECSLFYSIRGVSSSSVIYRERREGGGLVKFVVAYRKKHLFSSVLGLGITIPG